jgi:hypothetical protein
MRDSDCPALPAAFVGPHKVRAFVLRLYVQPSPLATSHKASDMTRWLFLAIHSAATPLPFTVDGSMAIIPFQARDVTGMHDRLSCSSEWIDQQSSGAETD